MKTFALIGNPNCGKTTLFNSLTGSTAHVGNWPGVTVDKKEGVYKKLKENIAIIDLPGIYSLSPYTSEEVISRNYILEENPACVINIVDATNLERNLYLTTQVMEMDIPMIIALNMMDEVFKRGCSIDTKELEKKLGVPVVPISALKEENLDKLMERAYKVSLERREGRTVVSNPELLHLINDVTIAFKGMKLPHPLFHAIKLVEKDELEVKDHKDVLKMVDDFEKTFKNDTFGNDFEALVADARYKFISSNFAGVVTKPKEETDEEGNVVVKKSRSDKIDKIITNKWVGIPIFLLILFLIFHLTFGEDLLYLGAIFKMPSLEDLGIKGYGATWLSVIYDGGVKTPGIMVNTLWNDLFLGEIFDGTSGAWGGIKGWIETWGMQDWASGLINNGIIDGLLAVLSFLPPILVLFLFFSILEDTGYMARVAFLLDRIFRKAGLSGRAFMPMIMGFGCSIPAMINTRTLADDRERTATIRVIPFFSCGAKLPVLTGIAGGIVVYFGIGNADLITFSMYVLGMVTAIIAIILMRNTVMRGPVAPFIMELPPYHLPQFKSLMLHLWDKCKHFVKKAFTIILVSTILIWFLTHFAWNWSYLADEEIEKSILASIGMFVQPILTPLGFGSQLSRFGWVFAVAAVTGLIAKENVMATFAVLASVITSAGLATIDPSIVESSGEDIANTVALIQGTGITIPALISFIAFNMLTIPCFAAVATAKAELPKKKLASTLLFWIGTSFVVSSMVYVIGSWWWTSFIFAAVIAGVVVCLVYWNKKHPYTGSTAVGA